MHITYEGQEENVKRTLPSEKDTYFFIIPLAVAVMIIQATPLHGYGLNGCGCQCFGRILYTPILTSPPFFKVLNLDVWHLCNSLRATLIFRI